MDIERALISKVIHEGDFITVVEEQISARYFSGENKKAFQFINKFVQKYGSVPSKRALKRKFPEYKLYKSSGLEEGMVYYCHEVREKTKHNSIVDGTQTVINMIKEEDIEGALRIMQDTLYDVEGNLVKSDRSETNRNTEQRLEAYFERSKSGGITGIPSGIDRLDKMTKGFNEAELIGIVGFTGFGKSWLLVIMATFIKSLGYKVLLFTTEMTTEALMRRVDAVANRLHYGRFSTGQLKEDELKKYEKYLKREAKKSDEDGVIVIEQVTAGVSEVSVKVDQHKPDIVMVDGAYLLADDAEGDDDWRALVRIFRGLQRLAKGKKLPVVVTTQSNEERATLSSISFAKHIRADVDVLIGMERDDEMKEDREMKLRPLKLREGDSMGSILMNWDFNAMDWSTIYQVDDDGQREEGDIEEGEENERDVQKGVMMI